MTDISNSHGDASTIAQRAVSSSLFQIVAQVITMVTGLTRSVLLARLLLPEAFGLVALGLLFANLVWNTTALGIDSRLIQSKRLDSESLSTHLALRLAFAIGALLILLAATPLLRLAYPTQPQLPNVAIAFAALNVLKAFNLTPFVLLKRELAFRRLAIIGVASSFVMLAAAPLLAWSGWGFWSLILGEALAGTLVSTLGLWIIRPPIKPSFRINREVARDLIGFGRFVMLTHQLSFLLDRFDDFWAGTSLGNQALGYYSKAYEFATYPRKIISRPLQDVFFSAYARLQHDRHNLSKAFFRANSYVIRLGFLFSALLALDAPEFVEYVLGKNWLPMVPAFQLMVVYCLLDPLLVTAGNLLTACGAPKKMTGIRLAQTMFFVPAVVGGAALWNINGIAIAADCMLLIGLFRVFWLVRDYVDISVRKLFAAPTLGLVCGGVTAVVSSHFAQSLSPLTQVITRTFAFGTPYVLVLLAIERTEYVVAVRTISQILGFRSSPKSTASKDLTESQ